MRRKLGTNEVLALIAAAGVSTCAAAQAAKVEDTAKSNAQTLQVTGQPAHTKLDKEMACGKGACGTDESGAKAAAEKHAAKKQAKETTKKVVTKKKVEEKKK